MKKSPAIVVPGRAPAALLTLLLLVALPAMAEQKKSAGPDRDPASEQTESIAPHKFEHARMISVRSASAPGRIGSSGVRAAIDPETGELRQPTPEEIRTLDLQMSADSLSTSSEPKQFQLSNGAVMIMVPDSLLNYSYASISNEGLAVTCLDGTHEAPAASQTSSAREEK